MVKLCRACRSKIADDATICRCRGSQQFFFQVEPTKLHLIWNLWALIVLVLSVASTSMAVGVIRNQRPRIYRTAQKLLVRPARKIIYQRSFVLEEETRKVYPYSIVPGGAATVDEAKFAMSRAEVHAYYADFNLAVLREEKLSAPLSGYVSYRYGEKTYWTAKTITLRAGETVFTDGVHIARGRCLNCYSAFPMFPTRPNEPTEKVLDTPVDVPVFAYKFPMLPVETPTLPPPPEELTPTAPILPTTTPTKPGGGIWFPLLPIIPPIHRHHPPPSGPILPPPIIPPVTVVPEPNYVWILAAGFMALVLAHGLRRWVIRRVPNLSIENRQPGGTSVVEP